LDFSIWQLLTLIVFGALADSIDPCIFALYVSLLLSASLAGLKHIAKTAAAFVSSVYIGYLLFGVILKTLVASWTPPRWILSAILIVYALAMIVYTMFFEGEASEMVCREDRIECKIASTLNLNRFANTKTSVFIISVLGFVASFTLLPCSAGLYIVFNFVTANMELLLWFPLAMLYTAIFVSPLILIAIAVAGLTKIEKAYRYLLSRQRLFKVAASIAMIIIALILPFY